MTVQITGSTLRVGGHRLHPGNTRTRAAPARSLYGRGLFIVGLLAGTWGNRPVIG